MENKKFVITLDEENFSVQGDANIMQLIYIAVWLVNRARSFPGVTPEMINEIARAMVKEVNDKYVLEEEDEYPVINSFYLS